VHIELIDLLRCPAPHPESMLVLTAERWDARYVTDGVLGCPVCRAEYPIRSGVVDFTDPSEETSGSGALQEPAPVDQGAVIRLAALLDLREPDFLVALGGRNATMASALADLVSARCLAVNAPGALAQGNGLAVSDRLPVATGALRGVALDELTASPVLLQEAIRVTCAGGRLVAPASTPVPAGVEILAIDARDWVGQVQGTPSGFVTLGSRTRDR
jgi:uncharacterized protein YbaR (Trm112 family)